MQAQRRVVRRDGLPAPRLAARLLEHVAAERPDQAGLLRQRDELRGRDQAAHRVLPAHERLGGADARPSRGRRSAGTRPRSRRARSPWPSSSLRSWRRSIAAAIGGSKNAKRPLPDVLAWYIARSASRISSSGVARPAAVGDADAEVDGHQLGAGVHRRLEGAQHPRGDGAEFRDGILDVRQHDRELVAAEPGDDVLRAHGVAQPARDGDEQRVADGVAERVVDDLEVVDVDEQHPERAGAVGELAAQPLHEQQPVRQVGERVVVGLVVELLLERAQLDHGLLEPVVLQRHAGVVGEHLEQPLVLAAVAALDAEAVGEHDDADHPVLAGQHRDHRVADPALLEMRAQPRRLVRAARARPPGAPRRPARRAPRPRRGRPRPSSRARLPGRRWCAAACRRR